MSIAPVLAACSHLLQLDILVGEGRRHGAATRHHVAPRPRQPTPAGRNIHMGAQHGTQGDGLLIRGNFFIISLKQLRVTANFNN